MALFLNKRKFVWGMSAGEGKKSLTSFPCVQVTDMGPAPPESKTPGGPVHVADFSARPGWSVVTCCSAVIVQVHIHL